MLLWQTVSNYMQNKSCSVNLLYKLAIKINSTQVSIIHFFKRYNYLMKNTYKFNICTYINLFFIIFLKLITSNGEIDF